MIKLRLNWLDIGYNGGDKSLDQDVNSAMVNSEEFKVERVLSIESKKAPSSDLEYWLSKTPDERLAALEKIRQVVYGYSTPQRLQRILEFASKARR